MSSKPVQYALPGSDTWIETPIAEKEKLSKPATRSKVVRVVPNRKVLLCILKKSQKILGQGHSLRTKSIITWDDIDGRERWVIDREIAVPGGAHVSRQLIAWQTLGHVESTKIENYICWRLTKPVPAVDESFPEVLL